jgi:hypothetical protein
MQMRGELSLRKVPTSMTLLRSSSALAQGDLGRRLLKLHPIHT